MWCTRWLLPLMFLPVPTAPPYFLGLFLISAIFHARPWCGAVLLLYGASMHCIIVLATLFVTSCYWSAVPANTISSEVFDRLNITLTNSTDPQWAPFNPPRELKWDQPIQLLSRCWCDFTRNPFFDNLDVSVWERDSVLAHPIPLPLEPSPPPSQSGGVSNGDIGAGSVPVSELDKCSKSAAPGITRRLLGYVVPKRFFGQSPSTSSASASTTASTPAATTRPANSARGGGGFMQWWRQKGAGTPDKPAAAPSPRQPAHVTNINRQAVPPVPPPLEVASLPPPPPPPPMSIFRPLFFPSILLRPITHWRFHRPSKATGKVQGPKLPWFRRRYDLSRHGIGIVLDFGWGWGEKGEPIGPA